MIDLGQPVDVDIFTLAASRWPGVSPDTTKLIAAYKPTVYFAVLDDPLVNAIDNIDPDALVKWKQVVINTWDWRDAAGNPMLGYSQEHDILVHYVGPREEIV